jgi:hypothetical protein
MLKMSYTERQDSEYYPCAGGEWFTFKSTIPLGMYTLKFHCLLLGAFAKLRNATVSLISRYT